MCFFGSTFFILRRIMKGLIFNCKDDELKFGKMEHCIIAMQKAANRKIMPSAPYTQNLINDYIDFVLKNEKKYMKKLSKSNDKEDKQELENLIACKKIMDLKYWKNYAHFQAIFKEGFIIGNIY